jgi:hypothetical protein
LGGLEDALPPEAQRRLDLLRLDRAEAVGIVRELKSRVDDLRSAIARQAIECDRLVGRDTEMFLTGQGANLTNDALSVLKARARLDRLKDELPALTERHAVAQARWEAVGQLTHRIEEFLDSRRGARFVRKPVALPANMQPYQALDLVEQKRRRVRELRSDLAKVEAAPWPSATAREHIRKYVGALVEKGRPDCSAVVDQRGGNITWPIVFPHHDPERILGLVAWTVGAERLIGALEVLIDAAADDDVALSDVDRATQIETLRSDLLVAQRDEAALVDYAMAQGIPAHHRSDIDPLAVLAVEIL